MSRIDRLSKLQEAVNKYVNSEKKRIENEVSVLEKVANGRNGKTDAIKTASDAALNDLASYLRG